MENKQDQFVKHDQGKTRYGLIPPNVLKAEAQVMTFGAEKYGVDNWRKCDDLSRYIDATMRHVEAYRSGEINDPESGFPHLAHARCCMAFLMEMDGV
ncbi:MAG: hypothetical protein JZU49_02910 [Sulfuricurvum sp.]|nr:hypothetical protein [Sulfuricurvum sp.]